MATETETLLSQENQMSEEFEAARTELFTVQQVPLEEERTSHQLDASAMDRLRRVEVTVPFGSEQMSEEVVYVAKSYLIFSIIHLLLCFFPLGPLSLWHSIQCELLARRGNLTAAADHGDKARKIIVYGAIISVAAYGITAAVVIAIWRF